MSKIFEAMELPKDIVLGIPYITMYGNLELIIENHKGIRCFNDELVEILAKSNIIFVNLSNFSFNTVIESLINNEFELSTISLDVAPK